MRSRHGRPRIDVASELYQRAEALGMVERIRERYPLAVLAVQAWQEGLIDYPYRLSERGEQLLEYLISYLDIELPHTPRLAPSWPVQMTFTVSGVDPAPVLDPPMVPAPPAQD